MGLKDTARILHHLQRGEEGQHRSVAGGELDPQMALLRAWQSERLARTHADLLEDPRYEPACRFFLNDIYAPRDFSQQDHDVERMYRFVSKFLLDRMLRGLALVIELNELTNQLDEKLLQVLVDELGMTDTITAEMYAEAYRICDNYDDRVLQIDLVVEIGRSVDIAVHTRFAGTTLRLARGPARFAGPDELHAVLERGYQAFKQMDDAEHFLDTIREHEMQTLIRSTPAILTLSTLPDSPVRILAACAALWLLTQARFCI